MAKARIRRNVKNKTPQFVDGEIGFDEVTNKFYVGNNGTNICINPDPDTVVSENSDNYVSSKAVAKAINDIKKEVDSNISLHGSEIEIDADAIDMLFDMLYDDDSEYNSDGTISNAEIEDMFANNSDTTSDADDDINSAIDNLFNE